MHIWIGGSKIDRQIRFRFTLRFIQIQTQTQTRQDRIGYRTGQDRIRQIGLDIYIQIVLDRQDQINKIDGQMDGQLDKDRYRQIQADIGRYIYTYREREIDSRQ